MTLRAVQRDDELPHQIRLFWVKRNYVVYVGVGCNCRPDGNHGKFEVIAVLFGDETPWTHYNKPENHNPRAKVMFDETWQGGPAETRTGLVEAGGPREATGSLLD